MVDTHASPKRKKNRLQGKLRQRTRNGFYSYRLSVSNGARKEFSLKTWNYEEAVREASEPDSIWLAPMPEAALAQMSMMRGLLTSPELDASFNEAWERYKMHRNRATPHTVEEQIGYRRTFREFANFASGITTRNMRHPATSIRAVTPELCEEFSTYLKTTYISVHAHNRKIKRLRLIFGCLKDYYCRVPERSLFDKISGFHSVTLTKTDKTPFDFCIMQPKSHFDIIQKTEKVPLFLCVNQQKVP